MARQLNKVTAQKRDGSGSAEARRLRAKGVLPAVVYDDQGNARSIQLDMHAFELMLKGHSSESLLLDLELDGAMKKVLLREVQHDPVHSELLHADFLEVSMTKKMRIELPIRLMGDPVGVTQNGGILEHLLRSVVVECLPGDVVESLSVDVSALAIGDMLSVSALSVDTSKMTILTGKDVAIARVAAPKAEEEEVKEAVAGEGTAEPEVIGAKKEEGEEEAAASEKKPAKDEKKKEEKK